MNISMSFHYKGYLSFWKMWISRCLILAICFVFCACGAVPRRAEPEIESHESNAEPTVIKPSLDDLRGFLLPKR